LTFDRGTALIVVDMQNDFLDADGTLEVPGGLDIIQKGTEGEDGYSGFSVRDPDRPDDISSTGLDGILDDLGVKRVVVVGVATDYCVKETALDAARLGFETIALTDGMRAVDLAEGDGDAALEAMREAGVTLS
jgi:nicotinamidase/pyrazinamidase